MKILHTLDSLNRGGTEMLILDVCRNARAGGLNISFAATGGGDLEEDFKNSGVDFFRLKRRLPFDFSVVKNLSKIIREKKIDIVHAHQAVEGIHAYFACRGTKAKLVLSFHGYIPDQKNRFALKYLIPRTAANIAVSREFLKWLAEKDKLDTSKNFHIIYNGIDEKRLSGSGKNFRNELNLPANFLLFGMIGNFYAALRKDQLTVCHALPHFFRRVPNAHFVFAGRAEENSDYEKCVRVCEENKIADKVSFLGRREDVADILKSLDVFVLSSRHESFGIAAVEAMLVKTPAIVSDIEPLLEVSGGGKFAKVFQTKNSTELSEKMIQLAENKSEREDLAERAFAFAKDNFSIEAHLRELKKLYENVLEK
jgi:glycosyltransferase involved in cell wall biosynthesis